MSTRSLAHEIELPHAPQRAFALLHTPSDVRAWWCAARVVIVPQVGGVWSAAWGESEDDPDYVAGARIAVFDPPRRLVLDRPFYHARSGPLPFEVHFETEFTVEARPGGCVLRVGQYGFPADPEADAFFAACDLGWQATLKCIRGHLDSCEALAPPGARPTRLTGLAPMLNTTDIRATIAFYTERLGFRLDGCWPDDAPCWCSLRRGDVHLMFTDHPHWRAEPARMTGRLYVYVDDVPALYERVRDCVKVIEPPEVRIYGMHEFAIADCNGYQLVFGQRTDAPRTCTEHSSGPQR